MKYTDGLFLDTARKVAKEYPDIEFEDRIVDNMCMQLVQKPELYDVLVLPNLYGDILSDLAAGLVGGLGVAPGANIGPDGAVFEATHGSAPKYKGQNKVNPTALILSGMLMLRHLGEIDAAERLEKAVADVIAEGKNVTYDMKADRNDPTAVGTREMAEAICKKLRGKLGVRMGGAATAISLRTGSAIAFPSHALPCSPSEFRELVSGRRRGRGGHARSRGCCALAEIPYTAAVRLAQSPLRSRPRNDPPRRRAGRQRRQSHAGRHRQDADWSNGWPAGSSSRACAWRWSAAATARRRASRTTKPWSWPQKLPGVPHVSECRSRARRAAGDRRVRLPVDPAGRWLSASPHCPRSGHRADRRPRAVRLRPRLSARHAARTAGWLAAGPAWRSSTRGDLVDASQRAEIRERSSCATHRRPPWVEATYPPPR